MNKTFENIKIFNLQLKYCENNKRNANYLFLDENSTTHVVFHSDPNSESYVEMFFCHDDKGSYLSLDDRNNLITDKKFQEFIDENCEEILKYLCTGR